MCVWSEHRSINVTCLQLSEQLGLHLAPGNSVRGSDVAILVFLVMWKGGVDHPSCGDDSVRTGRYWCGHCLVWHNLTRRGAGRVAFLCARVAC